MIGHSDPEGILESPVYIRSAHHLPPALGRGRVAIMGDAAHPIRTTGNNRHACACQGRML